MVAMKITELEEIDSELARYDNIGGSVHGNLPRSQGVGLHGPEIVGHQGSKKISWLSFNEKEAAHTGPAKGKNTYKARGLPMSDKVVIQHEPILSKWSVCDFSKDEEEGVHGKKKKQK
nr:hypothetical protein CFP56_44729 [Quercus suber]